VAAAHGGVAEAHGAIAEADAAIDRLKTVLADLRIVAPGKPGTRYTVEYRVVENGAVLPSGGRVVSLLNPDDVSLTLFLPAATVARLAVGMRPASFPKAWGVRFRRGSPSSRPMRNSRPSSSKPPVNGKS
jgi:HlyD family secretion protein